MINIQAMNGFITGKKSKKQSLKKKNLNMNKRNK